MIVISKYVNKMMQGLSKARHRLHVTLLLAFVFSICAGLNAAVAYSQTDVTTYRNDLDRTGQNVKETILTPSNVNSTRFGLLFSQPVDGAVYAQPLYMQGIKVNGGTHNVVYVATENDSVYAFDADSKAGRNAIPLWHASMLTAAHGAAAGATAVNAAIMNSDIASTIGITGTPVIDATSKTLYLVSADIENGVIVQRLHALDIATGNEKFGGPQVIASSLPSTATGSGDGKLIFDSAHETQSAALTLSNGIVYVGFVSDSVKGACSGWVIGYRASTLAKLGSLCSTANAASEVSDYTPAMKADINSGYVNRAPGGVMVVPAQAAVESSKSTVQPGIGVRVGAQGSISLFDISSLPSNDNNPDAGVTGLSQSPAFWNGNVYYWAGSDYLKSYALVNGKLSAPQSESAETSGYLGSTPSISADGAKNGIVWTVNSSGYASGNPAVLEAHNASNVAETLYSSSDNAERDSAGPAVKSTVPTISNGKVYVATANQIDVYAQLASQAAATPKISPGSGTYTSGQPITITDTTPNATIYFTIDGTMPTTQSYVYSSPIIASYSGTVNAIAVANGYSNSAVASATYTIVPGVTATPVISPGTGTYAPGQTITISDATPNATIYFTIDGSTPTAQSNVYTSPIIASYSGTVNAIALAPGDTNSAVASATFTITQAPAAINFANGFTNSDIILNGATISNGALELTDGGVNEAHTAWYATPVNVQQFTTDFTFQNSAAVANGFTIAFQNDSYQVYSVGGSGSGLGYSGISPSIAVKFDLFTPVGTGTDSTGFFGDGTLPTTPAFDMTPSGVLLNSGHIMHAHLTYDGTTLTLILTDTATGAAFVASQVGDLPAIVGGNTAYVGFTGGTGTQSAIQNILNWTYVAGPPTPTVAQPTFSPAAGTYAQAQTVTINSTPGASIYYTTNGTVPTISSTPYTGPITVGANETLNAIAVLSQYNNSPVGTAAYLIGNAATTNVSLSSVYDVYGIFPNGTAPSNGGLDNHAYAYSSNYLTQSFTWSGTPFTLANAGGLNAVTSKTIALPAGSYGTLQLLGTAVNGPQTNQPFVVTYSDGTSTTFTQSLSDWGSSNTFAGESVVQSTASRITPNGSSQAGPWNLYGYSFKLDDTKTVASLTLPTDRNVVVLAVALVPEPLIAQTISFPAISSQSAGSVVTLNASASSGLAVTFSSSTPAVCIVTGGTTSLLAAGTCTITAAQAGNRAYLSATSVTQSFSVAALSQSITFPAIASQTVGATVSLNATASSLLAVSYASTTPTVCSVSGSSATMVGVGTCTIVASQAGDSGYTAATPVSQSFAVTAALTGIGTPVNLASSFNIYGIFSNGTAPTNGGLGSSSYAYSSSYLGQSLTWSGANFALGSPNVADAVTSKTVPLPAGSYGSIVLLGTGLNNSNLVNQPFVVTYSDGTTTTYLQSLSDWGSYQKYSGESIAVSTTARITPSGATQAGPWNLYGYSFTLNSSKTVASIALPNSKNVVIFAITLVPFVPGSTAQTITFPVIPTETTGTTVKLGATASSGLTVAYSSSTPTVCTVSGSSAALIGIGVCTITASQGGSTTYAAAISVSQSFDVNAALPALVAPTFSPAAGTYSTAQSVTIGEAVGGSTIYYTTDGTAPTTASSIYTGPVTVGVTETLKAIAVETGYATSPTGTAAFTITNPSSGTPVSLTGVANVNSTFSDGATPTNGGLDGTGYAYSANYLPNPITWAGSTFTLGAAGTANAVSNTTVPLPAGKYGAIQLLGTSVNGSSVSQKFVVTYSDGSTSTFTQSLSDWGAGSSMGYAGESVVTNATYRITPSGALGAGPWNVYGYSFTLNAAKTVSSITLPANRDVVILGMSLVPLIPNGTYTITNENSGFVIDDPSSSTTAGTDLIQYPLDGGTNQKWQFTNLGNNEVQIVNAVSGLSLEVFSGSTANGAAIDQWPSNGGKNQIWQVVSAGNGYYELINEGSGKALEVPNSSKTATQTLDQSTVTGAANQLWQIK